MEFYTAYKEQRPVRLSETTRAFANASLNGKYGDEAMQTPHVVMDDVSSFCDMSPQEKYNACILKIAGEAPIRICDNETVSGAATLGMAISHKIPATFAGQPVMESISHLTVDFHTVIFKGVDHLALKIAARRANETDPDRLSELNGLQTAIDALHIYHSRYLAALQFVRPDIYENLKNVPFAPATNFREAVQSLWFTFSFIRLCGNWPGIGRIDEMLGGFLKNDLASGAITLDEAREFLAGMFIKGCEWIRSDAPVGSGDAQHYQNLVLAGIDVDGNEVTNEVTYLILDIVEELPISDFPITLRINENTPDKLLTRAAQVMRHGGGVLAVYNEPLILRALTKFGYSQTEARRFANDGCWEVQVPGRTYFGYIPFDGLQILLNDTLKLDTDSPAIFEDFDSLYAEYLKNLDKFLENLYKNITSSRGEFVDGQWQWKPQMPCSVISLFEGGCIDSSCSYLAGGAIYNVVSPHIGGAPDVGNSLCAIDRLVFREKKVTFAQLMDILKNDWEGAEPLRSYVSSKYTYYGNDDDTADSYTTRVLNDFSALTAKLDGRCPIRFPSGVSTFGRQIEWLPGRCAVPFGRKKGDILSGNASPTPDTDLEGATAIIRSYCKADLEHQVTGAALDVKLYPSTVEGENGLTALKALISGFLTLGGFFMQLDVVDHDVLRKAQLHPESYRTLSVRVSGWNARFITLDPKWQQMIIERNAQQI